MMVSLLYDLSLAYLHFLLYRLYQLVDHVSASYLFSQSISIVSDCDFSLSVDIALITES